MTLPLRGTEPPELSLVVPVYNEEEVLPELQRRLAALIRELGTSVEIILVDDGSRDRTGEILAELCRANPGFRSIHLARNFGHQAAVSAGVNRASGRAVVIMDADLQDPPELIPAMLAKWREGYEVVYAQRMRREREGWFKRFAAWLFYRVLQRLTDVRIPGDTGDFCLMDRRVVDHLNALPERNRYIRGLRAWLGFRQAAVPFDRPGRAAGEPKYTFWKSLRLSLDAMVGFSKLPLRIGTYLGILAAVASFLLGLFYLAKKLILGFPVQGWASIVVIMLFLGGVQLLTLGIIGEYLSRIYDEVKQRPLYVVRETIGFDEPPAEVASARPPDPRRVVTA